MKELIYEDSPLLDHGIRREYKTLTPKGERVIVDFIVSRNSGKKYGLAAQWKKQGFTKEELETWWTVSTYVYSHRSDGFEECVGKYNPTHKHAKGRIGEEMNFRWVLEATSKNREKILREIERRAFRSA